MIFSIYGADAYRCREKLEELKKSFIAKRDQTGLNVVKLNGETLDIGTFKQEAMSAPFLAEKKMILVSQILKNKNKEILKELVEFLSEQEAKMDNVVGFIDILLPDTRGQAAPTGPLFKFLSRQKFAWEFNPLKNKPLTDWTTEFAAAHGISIEKRALTELIALCGNDLYAISTELKKLKAYRKEELITAEDVKKMVSAKFSDHIFDLIDAIGQKNQKMANKLVANQLNAGTHELQIFKMIARQFKIIIQIKDGATAAQIGVHPFVFQKARGQAGNFTLEKLKEIYQSLVDMEADFKRGQRNPELVFNLFIAKNCQN